MRHMSCWINAKEHVFAQLSEEDKEKYNQIVLTDVRKDGEDIYFHCVLVYDEDIDNANC